jgi:TonB-dependent SusC/RagA subfamily outer membrane receptor
MACNIGYAQKTLVWSELCDGYGSGLPLIIIDGILVEPDSVLSTTIMGEGLAVKNGRKSSTVKPEDIESVDVLKVPSGSIGHGPDNCIIVINTKKVKKHFQTKQAQVDFTKNTRLKYMSCRSSMGQPGQVYLIDGEQVYADSLINPLDNIALTSVTSISVLKGSIATALCGANAAHGVILITTNRTRREKRKFEKKDKLDASKNKEAASN